LRWRQFLRERDPRRVVEEHGLDGAEQESALAIDRPGLLLTARSIAAKRNNREVRAGAFQRAIAGLDDCASAAPQSAARDDPDDRP